MIPITFISLGLIISFVSAIKLLKFSSLLAEKLSEINELFSSDIFLMHKNLMEEMDELNYSYYEILERQDERISSLESKLETNLSLSSDAKPLAFTEKAVLSSDFLLSPNESSLISKDSASISSVLPFSSNASLVNSNESSVISNASANILGASPVISSASANISGASSVISSASANISGASSVISSEVERSPDQSSLSLEEESLNSRVLKMNYYGISKEKIASELKIGIGMVEVICSVYAS